MAGFRAIFADIVTIDLASARGIGMVLARSATNPQLTFKSAVEHAVAVAEARSSSDHEAILEILDRIADGTNMPADHDRLVMFVNRYRPVRN